jgi:1-acyl-sn-glycerol-3-phosphate acyltransferase
VIEGTPVTERPTLYISNHISYLDIFVLGSILPGTFIAKSEIAKWPLFGQLARLQNSLFIERRSQKVGSQIQQVNRHLVEKSNLILFPEGTSAIGTFVAPFHTSFFQSAEDKETEITIQPITVAYTHYEDERMDREARDYYAWYKPRKIVPHFMNALGLGSARVMVICHEPVKFEAFESRKACSRHCEIVIRQGLLDALDLEKEETVVMSR